MQVLTSNWFDEMGTPFNREIFDVDIGAANLLKKFITVKEIHKKQVLSRTKNECLFSDGTRVVIFKEKIQTKFP